MPASSPEVFHYVIVRNDLPVGVAAAMIVHAAGETGPSLPNTRAVVLAVPNELALWQAAAFLAKKAVTFTVIRESEGEYAHQGMAIGLRPILGKREYLGHLPLY